MDHQRRFLRLFHRGGVPLPLALPPSRGGLEFNNSMPPPRTRMWRPLAQAAEPAPYWCLARVLHGG